MKRLLTCFAITAFVSGCGQTTPTVTTAPKPTPATNQTRVRAQSLTATNGVMQIVAHDGDKEANSLDDKSLTNDSWNYSTRSAQSAFSKGVDWLETDVILNKPSGILYMQHSKDCKKGDGIVVDLMTAPQSEIGDCAEMFTEQLYDIGRVGQFMIELKGDKDFGSAMTDEYRLALTNTVYDKLKLFDRLSTEIITSMDVEALKMIKARADAEGIAVHLTHVYKMFKDGGIQRADLNQDKANGFEYVSVAVKDWEVKNVDYARAIGLQTMGWGWDDWWTGGRNPVEDNIKGINLCVDLMLTEAIDDLKIRDKTCKHSRPNFNSFNTDSNEDSDGNPAQEIQYDLYMENRCVFDPGGSSPFQTTYTYSYIYSTDGTAPNSSQPRQINDDYWTGYDRHLVWNAGTKWGTNGTSLASAYLDGEQTSTSGEIHTSFVCTYRIGKRSEFSYIIPTRNVFVTGPIDDEIIRKDYEERSRR